MSTTFAQMGLPSSLLKAIDQLDFHQATPIQAKAIPVALAGRDIMGSAQTGTGKTAAFCIPVIAGLLENPEKTAFVLAPTRELAQQIREVLRGLTKETPEVRVTSIIGGADLRKQKKNLQKNPRVVVATPGRLADHVRRKNIDPQKVGYVVLDEGDRMLDMGFEKQIDEILKQVPKERQTLLFSATLSPAIQRLAQRYLHKPEYLSVGKASQPVAKIHHSILPVPSKAQKAEVLLDQLNSRQGSVLIFVNTKWGTNKVAQYLKEYGHSVTRLHGDRTQGQRNQALQGFRSGEYRIMVATDVAARGLDVPHIAHVINFDLPKDHSDYVHRIGRTARAGAPGQAICLISPEERGIWGKIAKLYQLEALPGAKEVEKRPAAQGQRRPPGKKPQQGRRFSSQSGGASSTAGGGGGRGRKSGGYRGTSSFKARRSKSPRGQAAARS